MPPRPTIYGYECPLDKFKIDEVTGGCYTSDPLAACLNCNFADLSSEGFDLEKICQCLLGMTWDKYDELRKQYASTDGELTKEGFQRFVKENRNK